MSIRSIFKLRRTPPLGVEFCERGLRLVQVGATSDEIRRAVLVPFESNGDVDPGRLRAALRGFRGRDAVVAPPRADITVRPARLPLLVDAELREAARWEAAGLLEIDASDVVADALPLSSETDTEGRTEMLVVAASASGLEQRLAPLITAGLRPIALEPAFFGAGRAFTVRSRRQQEQHEIRVVVDVSETESWIVVTRGDRLMFAKRSDVGGAAFDAELAAGLGIEPSTARRTRLDGRDRTLDPEVLAEVMTAVRRAGASLADEIAMAVRYVTVTTRLGRPQALHLSGEAGATPGLQETIESSIPGIPVESASFVEARLEAASSTEDSTPLEWAAAFGLAIRPMTRRGKEAA
ncbi:MAG: pilus assembly protein PilM [Phycisphaerales bacterium]|nr:pilus assembly protein PilM [Phycisphaerales bacterium]